MSAAGSSSLLASLLGPPPLRLQDRTGTGCSTDVLLRKATRVLRAYNEANICFICA